MAEFLTAPELAKVLRLSPSQILLMARKGRIPVIRISTKVLRFDPKAVSDALSQITPQKGQR